MQMLAEELHKETPLWRTIRDLIETVTPDTRLLIVLGSSEDVTIARQKILELLTDPDRKGRPPQVEVCAPYEVEEFLLTWNPTRLVISRDPRHSVRFLLSTALLPDEVDLIMTALDVGVIRRMLERVVDVPEFSPARGRIEKVLAGLPEKVPHIAFELTFQLYEGKPAAMDRPAAPNAFLEVVLTDREEPHYCAVNGVAWIRHDGGWKAVSCAMLEAGQALFVMPPELEAEMSDLFSETEMLGKRRISTGASGALAYFRTQIRSIKDRARSRGLPVDAPTVRARMFELSPGLPDITVGSVESWLRDRDDESTRPHTAGDERHFRAFLQALGDTGLGSAVLWPMVCGLRNYARQEGRMVRDFFEHLLFDPDDLMTKIGVPPDKVWRLRREADRHARVVAEVIPHSADQSL
jgi:hypothetical protein